jgi:hypothetical protein
MNAVVASTVDAANGQPQAIAKSLGGACVIAPASAT